MFFNKKINYEETIKEIYSQLVQNKIKKVQKLLSDILKHKDYPQNINIDIARIYFELQDYKNANNFYLLSLENEQFSTDDLYKLVTITNELKLNEECQNYCTKILNLEPNDLKILDIYLQKQLEQNQMFSAIETIDKMLVLQKNILDFNELKMLKANIHFDVKQYDEAETIILELLQTDENNTKYLSILANIYREKNMQQELLEVLKKIYSKSQQIQEAREISSILFQQKKYDETEQFIISCKETDFYIKKILIETNIEQQKYTVAFERINKFLINDKNNFDFYKLKAKILIKKLQFKAAIDLLENSVDFVDTVYLEEINSLLKDVHIEFSKYLLEKKNYEQAFAVLENASKYGNEDDLIYYTLAKCNFEICDYKKALLNLSKAIEINPINYKLYELMSEIYIKNENFEQAVIQQLESVKINPANYYGLTKLAYLYTQIQDFKSALNYFLKAQAHNNSSDLEFNIALCYHKLNDKQKAQEYYQKALELNNDNENARKNLEILMK